MEARLSNADLAPVPLEGRTWGWWNIAALWIAMSICIPTYTLASSLIAQGMDWKAAIGTVFLGNVIVLVPMALNAYAGTAYGIPFPILVRSSFGILGSNVPALMRALVACGWFGIQCWIGGMRFTCWGRCCLDTTRRRGRRCRFWGFRRGNCWASFCFGGSTWR